MRFLSLLSLLLLFLPNQLRAQSFDHAFSFGGSLLDWPLDLETDASGNVYVCGYYWNTVDFDPGLGVVSSTSNGGDDAFVAKYDANGNLLWVRTFGAGSGDRANGLSVDQNGNVLVTGRFVGTVTFPGNNVLTTFNSGVNIDAYVLKLDSNGNFLDVIQIGGNSGFADGRDIEFTPDGNFFYLTGVFAGLIDADGSATNINLQASALQDVFVGLYDSGLDVSWAVHPQGAAGNEIPVRLKYAGFGQIYITGTYDAQTDFDPSSTTVNIGNSGGLDVFVLKLDGNGDYVWARGFGGSSNDSPFDLDLDNFNNVVTVGQFMGTADMDPSASFDNITSNGVTDGFMHRIDPSGNYLDTYLFTGSEEDVATSIDVDAYGNFLIGGYFKGDIETDQSISNPITSQGNFDSFFCKLNSSVGHEWTQHVSSTDLNRLRHAAWTILGGQVIAGDFFNDLTFGFTTLSSSGSSDVFISYFEDPTVGMNVEANDFRIWIANGQLMLEGIESQANISVYDMAGKLIQSGLFQGQYVPLERELTTGVYLVTVQTENDISTNRVYVNASQ